MAIILNIIIAWFLISIPASLILGYAMSGKWRKANVVTNATKLVQPATQPRLSA